MNPQAGTTPASISRASEAPPADALLRDILHGFRATQALFVAAELGIADHLAQGARHPDELAARTQTDAAALTRIIRALCALGVFSEAEDGSFSLTHAGDLLRGDVRGSYRPVVLLLAGRTRWRCWSSLLETVRTGVNAAEHELGMQLFDFYASQPAESRIHDEAMRSMSAGNAKIVEAIDVGNAGVIVDVGGGTGELLAGVLTAHGEATGILFDLPEVVRNAPEVLAAGGVAQRCRIEPGSFFDRVPRGDLYLLKQVLHDWDDARAVAILACCRRHMPANARLMVIERRMPERAEPGLVREAFMTDLEMLVMTPGGRERTESELQALFTAAGFQHVRTVSTGSTLSVFEARPVASTGGAARDG
jgi:hypothetical protein